MISSLRPRAASPAAAKHAKPELLDDGEKGFETHLRLGFRGLIHGAEKACQAVRKTSPSTQTMTANGREAGRGTQEAVKSGPAVAD